MSSSRACLLPLALVLCFKVLMGSTPLQGADTPPIQSRLPDGVLLWKANRSDAEKPPFFALFENLARVVMPSKAELPFEKSIAFLVGVSDYKYLEPDLPFVKNDLQDMRNYLLQRGGFDEVYVAAGSIASYELIESYMMNKFRMELGKRDRLLFYYAGHGADASGITGYLQFSNARAGDFGRHVLPVSRVLEWGRVNPASHMLFILDTCSSGLAFTPRTGTSEEDEQKLIHTLSGRGSRTIITAGTSGEKTFEVKTSGSRGNGVFTQAFLGILEKGRMRSDDPAFLTIDQIFADLKISIAKFAAVNQKSLNPKLWTFDDDQYRGTFVFLNPAVRPGKIQQAHLAQINARPRSPDSNTLSAPSEITISEEGLNSTLQGLQLRELKAENTFRPFGRHRDADISLSVIVTKSRPALADQCSVRAALENSEIKLAGSAYVSLGSIQDLYGKTLWVKIFCSKLSVPLDVKIILRNLYDGVIYGSQAFVKGFGEYGSAKFAIKFERIPV